MSWSECCGCAMAVSAAFSATYDAVWCSTAVEVVAQTSYFVSASYLDRKPMK